MSFNMPIGYSHKRLFHWVSGHNMKCDRCMAGADVPEKSGELCCWSNRASRLCSWLRESSPDGPKLVWGVRRAEGGSSCTMQGVHV